MNIAIIGAGFTGLTAAYRLLQHGHTVTIFEKDAKPGGLAIGYKEKEWEWSVEHHYHHWFTNDITVLNLANEIGYEVLVKRPKTSVYIEDEILQLDSPLALLRFSKLAPTERIRMGAVLAALRYNPIWKPLEKIQAATFLPRVMGQKGYSLLWEPQMVNKFGPYVDEMSLAWFWARITKRTSSLAYPKGGFLAFAEYFTEVLKKAGAKVLFNSSITHIESKNTVSVTIENKPKKLVFDKVIITLPLFLFFKIAPHLPQSYKEQYGKLKGLGATNLLLRLNKQFMTDNTYWLSVCEKNAPIMAVVEHTNFMDKKYYNNEHLVYLGNYLPNDHSNFAKTKDELFKLYDPFLQKINPQYKKSLIGYELFKAPFAQPIVPINYSHQIPPLETPLAHVYLANIQQVYPWDRGTNYAAALGERVAALVNKQKR
jgi:protoporphyrinogen oxidase